MTAAVPVKRVYNFPGWRDNPYVQLLQAEAVARGYEMAGTPDMTAALRELTDPRATGLVHIQWPTLITETANERDARRQTDLFLDAVHTARLRGRPVLWTVHNVLPHENRYPELERDLHRRLAELADSVHVLSPHTAELAAAHYELPASKVVVIPHSSYGDHYGPAVPRPQARERVGSRADGVAVLFFGWIRPYKGVEHLVGAIERLGADTDIELLIAGRPKGEVTDVLARIEALPTAVTSHLSRVLPDDVAAWFGAADVIVLPYRGILNSGTMFLAATYGVPTILPDVPHLRAEFGDQEWIRFFDTSDPERSIAAQLASRWYLEPAASDAAIAFAESRPPAAMASAYADLVDRLSGASGSRQTEEPRKKA